MHKKVDKETESHTHTNKVQVLTLAHQLSLEILLQSLMTTTERTKEHRDEEKEDWADASTDRCVYYACVYVCELMAHFQLAALSLTQIKSGYLCLTLTVVLSADFSTYVCICVCACFADGYLHKKNYLHYHQQTCKRRSCIYRSQKIIKHKSFM